jgi:hypothetical protein
MTKARDEAEVFVDEGRDGDTLAEIFEDYFAGGFEELESG